MPTTIKIHAAELNSSDTNTIYLFENETLLNTGGDTLSHDGNNHYSATVSESLDSAVDYDVEVRVGSTVILTDILFRGTAKVGDLGAKLAGISSGGGDATLAKQNEILTKLSSPAKIYTNPSDPNLLELIRGPDGNAYDNVAKSKLSWDAGKSIDGETFSLKIVNEANRFDDNPTLHLDVSGTGSGQLAEPSVTNDDIEGLPTDTDLWFWLTIEYAAQSHDTIAQGRVCVI